MFCAWIVLFPLLQGGSSFMIYNTHHSLCLEDAATTTRTGPVWLKKCNLDSDLQQWIWKDQRMLECVGSSRCLSARPRKPVQTQACREPGAGAAQLQWDCEGDKLISLNTSLLLSIHGQHLILSHKSKHSRWRSLDEGDICQEKLRSRRASGDAAESETEEQKREALAAMTEEQRHFLQWYYRTEDPTSWKFAMLALSFTCLLVGFLLLGMGSMANRSRKKIAKYKAAAALAPKTEELPLVSEAGELEVKGGDVEEKGGDVEEKGGDVEEKGGDVEASRESEKVSSANGEVGELKAGSIVLTWKDGNISNLYPDTTAHALENQKEAERVEEKGNDVEGKGEEVEGKGEEVEGKGEEAEGK